MGERRHFMWGCARSFFHSLFINFFFLMKNQEQHGGKGYTVVVVAFRK